MTVLYVVVADTPPFHTGLLQPLASECQHSCLHLFWGKKMLHNLQCGKVMKILLGLEKDI